MAAAKKTGGKRKKPSGGGTPYKALAHPLRVHILVKVAEEGKLSPTYYHQAEGINLNVAAYHFRVLEKFGAIECVDAKQRRGATEHFYAIRKDSPVFKVLLTSKLIDFEEGEGNGHASSATSLRTVKVDAEGVGDIERLIDEVVPTALREVEARAEMRIEESGEEPTYLHFGSVAFGDSSPKRGDGSS